jgi:hypothetical protein
MKARKTGMVYYYYYDKSQQSQLYLLFLVISDFSDRKVPDTSPPPSRTSAQHIMARTRAKLAKLRAESSQTSFVDVVPGKLSVKANETQPDTARSTLDLRARLIERLEEERRAAGSVSRHVGKSTCRETASNDRPISLPHTESSSVTSAIGNDEATAHQIEKQLRTQTLLRKRLAAEKKKFDVLPANQASGS